MPYIQKLTEQEMYEQIWQWEGVMKDPMLDGFNGWGCKQKLYNLKFVLDEALKDAPHYHGEDEWLTEQKLKKAEKILSGR